MRSLLTLAALSGLLLATGCPSQAPDPGEPAPDWGFVSAVLASSCSPCHTGAPGYPGSDPMSEFGDAEAAYDLIVGHPAAETGGTLNRVTPGDSANSYLVQKLRGTHGTAGSGAQMPENGPYLEEATIVAIEQWVDAGASEDIVAGDDDDATGDDDDATGDDDDSATGPMSFSDVYSTILSNRCSCHNGAAHSTGFFMDGSAATAYGNLVDIPAFELATMSRIDPGNPDTSYLVNKIQGTAGTVGGANDSQMPLSGGPLSQGDIDTIRQWVTDGANP